MQVHWVFDTLLTNRYGDDIATGFPTLIDAAREQGFHVHQIDYKLGRDIRSEDIAIPDGNCVVMYGTQEFVKRVRRRLPAMCQPGAYLNADTLRVSAYAAHIGDLLLNDDFILVPFLEFRRRRMVPAGGAVFVRPDTVMKTFTGFVVKDEEFDHEINALLQISKPDPEALVVVASPKPIKAEFRFFIADRAVVTGSEYRWDNRIDIRSDVHPACLEMAQEVARRDWQADTVYVCDVALIERAGREEARVVELNAFSCAGLYASDTRAIVAAVSRAAWDDFKFVS
jgi:hypothetical protein